ncbi:MAG TPA: hypothetical protein VJ932_01915 [Alkalispirochaeta sp.]|nr:hypothetical protein [Alkalispirochaeta sp.]
MLVQPRQAAHTLSGTPQLLRFWVPLALIGLIMGVEQPTIAAVVSRLPNPAQSLAAYEVAFGLAALIHSPILQLLSAGTARIVDRPSYNHMFRFFLITTGALTAIHLLIGLTGLFDRIAGQIIGIPADLVDPARIAFLALAPISAAVGFRRLLQGAMVRARTIRSVAVVTLIRLAATTLFLGSVLWANQAGHRPVPGGGTIAAIAFTTGVVAGAVVAGLRFKRVVIPTLAVGTNEFKTDTTSVAETMRFYTPLALTGVVMTIGRPLLVWSITRSDQAVSSLAAWPLVLSFVGIFQALAMSYQEVVVGHVSEQRDAAELVRRTATVIGMGLTGVAALIFLTPLREVWFRTVVNAPENLMPLILPAIVIVTPMPWIATRIAMFNGILIATGRTAWVTAAMAVRILGYVAFGLMLPLTTSLPGTVVAAITLVGSGLMQLALGVIAYRTQAPL